MDQLSSKLLPRGRLRQLGTLSSKIRSEKPESSLHLPSPNNKFRAAENLDSKPIDNKKDPSLKPAPIASRESSPLLSPSSPVKGDPYSRYFDSETDEAIQAGDRLAVTASRTPSPMPPDENDETTAADESDLTETESPSPTAHIDTDDVKMEEAKDIVDDDEPFTNALKNQGDVIMKTEETADTTQGNPVANPVIDFDNLLSENTPASPYSITPMPNPIPPIHVDSRRLFACVKPAERALLTTPPRTSLLSVASFDHVNNELIAKADLFDGVLRRFLPASTSFSLKPLAVEKTNQNYGTPCPILINNITRDERALLLGQKVFDCIKGCIVVHEIAPPIHPFLLRLEGIPEWDSTDARRAVIVMVAKTIMKIKDIRGTIAKVGRAYTDVEPEDRLKHFLSTLQVSCISTKTRVQTTVPVWLIYGLPFTKNEKTQADFIKILKEQSYEWTGRMAVTVESKLEDWLCKICFAADHPTGLCPLSSIPGFVGARPVSTPANNDAIDDDDTPFTGSSSAANQGGSRNRGGPRTNRGRSL